MTERLKKVFLLIAVFVLSICVVAFAASCDKEENGGSQKTITNLEATLADGSSLTYSNGMIIVTEGQIPSFTTGDFSVKIVYSDGSKEAVSGFTIDASAIPANATAGSYTISFSYSGHSTTVSVEVRASEPEALPAIDSQTTYSYEYTGSAIDLIEKLDANRSAENKIAPLITAGKIRISTQENVRTRQATNVGDYMLELVAADGNVWKDETLGQTSSMTLLWRITKKVIPTPTVSGSTTFEYTGEEITLPVDLHGFDEQITFFNGGIDTNKAIDANYPGTSNYCQAIIKEQYQDSYTFQNDQYTVEVGTWTITPKRIPYPTLIAAENATPTYKGYTRKEMKEGVDYYHYTYTGNPIPVETSVERNDLFEVERNGTTGITDVISYEGGCYAVFVNFADQNKIGNYVWTNGTPISQVMFNVIVDPADYVFPENVASATLRAETTYVPGNTFATEHSIEWSNETVLLLHGIWRENDSTLTYADDKEYKAGVQTMKFIFKRDNNYKPLSINVEVTVHQAVVEVGDPTWYAAQNTSDPGNNYDVREGDFIYNGLPQRKQLEIYYGSYEMADEQLFAKVKYEVYYGKSADNYGKDPIQTIVIQSNDRGMTYRFAYDGVDSAAVGYYKTVATLMVDGGNYSFVNLERHPISGVFETTWRICKATLTLYPCYYGTHYRRDESNYFAGKDDSFHPFSYYTGLNKTVLLNEAYTELERASYYSSIGQQMTGYVTLSDYIDLDTMSTFFYNTTTSEWELAKNMSAVGKYKTVMNATLKEGLLDKYDLVLPSVEWYIYPNTYDLSGLTWTNAGTYEYDKGMPEVSEIPEGLELVYSIEGAAPYNYGNVGLNKRYVTIQSFDYVDGCYSVVLTRPDSWHFQENYYSISSEAEFTITKRILTINDFCLLIDNKKVDPPYEIPVGDGNEFHFSSVGGNELSLNNFRVERYDWEPVGGYGCLSGVSEIGSYTVSGFIWIPVNPMENFGFDEEAADVEAITEDYVYGDQTIISLPSTPYKYKLNFSFTWKIVENA